MTMQTSTLIRVLAIWSALMGWAMCLAGCGGDPGEWGVDPQLVGSWELVEIMEDGFPTLFDPKLMVFRANASWRSHSADGSWSRGRYRTREGKLNYWINASDDPENVGGNYVFRYEVAGNSMSISGHMYGHHYVAIFRRA